jgi:hypothetical protein
MARKKVKYRPVYRKGRDNMMTIGVKNLVGVGMIGATASMTNALPTGTAKSVASIVPGLQATALVGENMKCMGMGFGKKRRLRRHRK